MKQLLFVFLFPLLSFAQSNFDKAVKLFKENKFEQAQFFFEIALKVNPSDLKTIEYLGDIAGHNKSWDRAIGYYQKLKQLKPTEANYQYKYGGALGMKAKVSNKFKALGMIDDIENAFLTAAKLDAKHIDTRWALVILYIELPGIVGGSEKKAQKFANELSAISKVDGYLAKGYIESYYKRYEKAEINYKKAYEIGHSKTTFDKLYDLYLTKLKDTQKAIKLKNNQ